MSLFRRTPRPSTCTVRVANAGLTFEVPRNRLLLGGALDQGVAYPHNCRVGTCGSCKTTLRSGRIRPLIDFALSPLTAAELREGCILACRSKVLGDLEIEAPIARGGGVPVQRVTGRVAGARAVAHDVVDLRLRLDETFRFQPGQWASIGARDSEVRRAFSFHTPCDAAGTTEVGFYIKRLPGGAFSEWLFAEDRTGVAMDMLGPFGVLGDREMTGHGICVAGSTGLAPVICLVEAALEASAAPTFTVVFGVRHAEDLFAVDRLEGLARRHPGRLTVVPMLSHEPEGGRWPGRRGLVTAALTAELAVDPATTRAFLCGNTPMVDACERRLVELGVSPNRVHADRFVPTGATVGAIMAS